MVEYCVNGGFYYVIRKTFLNPAIVLFFLEELFCLVMDQIGCGVFNC